MILESTIFYTIHIYFFNFNFDCQFLSFDYLDEMLNLKTRHLSNVNINIYFIVTVEKNASVYQKDKKL